MRAKNAVANPEFARFGSDKTNDIAVIAFLAATPVALKRRRTRHAAMLLLRGRRKHYPGTRQDPSYSFPRDYRDTATKGCQQKAGCHFGVGRGGKTARQFFVMCSTSALRRKIIKGDRRMILVKCGIRVCSLKCAHEKRLIAEILVNKVQRRLAHRGTAAENSTSK